MKKSFVLCVLALCPFALSAQETNIEPLQVTQPSVVVRASGNFSMINIHFREFPNRFQLGGGAKLAAAYEHPIAPRAIIGAGAGGSIEKVFAQDKTYYYQNMMLSAIYAEVYYGYRSASGFMFELGLQGGYTPPIITYTNAPAYEGGPGLRRLSPYACKGGNIWFTGRVGYYFGDIELALDLRYAMISQFGEAFAYPMLNYEDENAYRDVLSRHLGIGISIGYRFGLGK